jgi:hypothetical protein
MSTMPDLSGVLSAVITAIANTISAIADAVAANAGMIATVLIAVAVFGILTSQAGRVFGFFRGLFRV